LTRRLRHLPWHEASARTLAHLRSFVRSLRDSAYAPGELQELVRLMHSVDYYARFLELLTSHQKTLVREIWSIGQHHGLWTPCLDWTESPFVAFFFAVSDTDGAPPPSPARVVYALNRAAIQRRCKSLPSGQEVEFFDPVTTSSERVRSQSGVLTLSPDTLPLDIWIEEHFRGRDDVVLLSFLLQKPDTRSCLKALDQMNISHGSLFPGFDGSGRACNQRMTWTRP
jgi:hypothetical protein